MGGFSFGSIGDIKNIEGTLCFLLVIAFVTCAEFIIGFLEYLLEGNAIYNQMIQKVYKELMLMGIISFLIIMYNASEENPSPTVQLWIKSIDFGHIILFFVAIFFVVHAFLLIHSSRGIGKKYIERYCLPISELVAQVEETFQYRIGKYFYEQNYIPFSPVRETVEFKIYQLLFKHIYCLPDDFNFAYYLTGCFEKYALKSVEMGITTWGVLVLLVITNFIRVYFHIGFSCPEVATYDHTDDHTDDHSDDHTDDHSPTYAPTVHVRFLASSGAAETTMSDECYLDMVVLFLFLSIVFVAFILILLVMARVYEVRYVAKPLCAVDHMYFDIYDHLYLYRALQHMDGVRNPDQYVSFLKTSELHKKRLVELGGGLDATRERNRRNRSELKNTIVELLDDEEFDEETATYRTLLHYAGALYGIVSDGYLWVVERFMNVCDASDEGDVERRDSTADVIVRSILSSKSDGTGHGSANEAHTHRNTVDLLTHKQPNVSGSAVSPTRRARGVPVSPFSGPIVEEETGAHTPVVNSHPNPHVAVSPTPSDAVLDADPSACSQTPMKSDDTRLGSNIPTNDNPNPANGVQHFLHDVLTRENGELVSIETCPPIRDRRSSVAALTHKTRDLVEASAEVAPLEESSAVETFRNRINSGDKSECGSPFTQQRKNLSAAMRARTKSNDKEQEDGDLKPSSLVEGNVDVASQRSRVDSLGSDASKFYSEEELKAIFMFGNPKFFFSLVDIAVMLHCIYLAMWATNFISIVQFYTVNKWVWQLLMLVPIVISFPCIGITIRICSQLNAIVNLDLEVVHNVLEAMDDAELLKKQLRERVLSRINEDGELSYAKQAEVCYVILTVVHIFI